MGYTIELQAFPVRAWSRQDTRCQCVGEGIPVVSNPYSPPCRLTAVSVTAGTREELDRADLEGKIVVLHGELTREPLMPRNFRFYTHTTHQDLVRLLEEKKPAALVTISPDRVHAVPVIIDGDVFIPSCTVAALNGEFLLSHAGETVTLDLGTASWMTQSANVIGRPSAKAPGASGTDGKIVLAAHFDTKYGTPGALDNAAGLAALLGLARVFRDRPATHDIEFVFFNGEECYCAPGESAYLDAGSCTRENTALGINIDGAGLQGCPSSISYYGCPGSLFEAAESIRSHFQGIEVVDPWPQGDHMIFFMQGIPCIAFSTKGDPGELGALIHTPADTHEVLDEGKIEQIVRFVVELVRRI